MNIELLKESGLTDGEIKVYLAMLELGSTTTGPIIDRSGIARSIIYNILERLIEKGLVSFIIKDKTKYFQASQPKKIIDYIDEKEKKLADNRDKIIEMLPQLEMLQKLAPESEARMYFGFKGIRTAHERIYEVLKKGECFYWLGIPAYQPNEQHIYWKKDHAVRVKKGIKIKVLFNYDTDASIPKQRNTYKDCEARIMKTKIKTPAAFVTYKDTTLIVLQSPNEIAIEIKNQDVHDSFKAYFDEFWKQSIKP
ncbi:hypothetical protein H6503_05680 [Candidatus Woesearchaeota archaeon]|nr:hypothetical protein [Candidatus Woesearchaeota archaeon]